MPHQAYYPQGYPPMYAQQQPQQLHPQAEDPVIRGITSRLDALAQNVTRVINAVDDGGHQGDSEEANSRAEGNPTGNRLRERRRRQHAAQFVEPEPEENANHEAPPRVTGTTRSREERDGMAQEIVPRRMRHRQESTGAPYPHHGDTERNTIADPEAFREMQDQLADIQDQIHYGHRRSITHRESPFVEGITTAEISNNFKMPRKDMCGYGGTGDPDDHLDSYLDWMNMQGASDAVKCRVFPLTLSGDARTWYRSLKRQSISSFNELSKEFRGGFAASRRRRRHMVHLTSIRQLETESIRDYMKRFTEAARDSKSHDTSTEPSEVPRRWGRQARDKGKKPQISRQVNTGNTARNTRFPPRDKFEEYTPLRFPLDRILEIANKEKLLRKPEPLYSAPERRDRRIHCKFHNDHGHETRKCRDLRDQVEELVRNDDEEPINFIDAVPVAGDPGSTSSGKAPASVCLTTTPEDAPRHWAPLSFSTEDSYGIRYPHCDALVISVKVRNRTVKRTLIDHGSSLDIIH
ncbi:hypothetical protein EZV62_019904 [Acer yangbiense]|uniref:Retrotransposon gag domain-containing protein n=1 Tax=Acer yangbiense TaxID=1000413 RepID=A0A5C7HCQ5_9ROSI|nr:hypothetical protein EZV62_019904 [Acer yangbiense]